jgi:hypothetical protein
VRRSRHPPDPPASPETYADPQAKIKALEAKRGGIDDRLMSKLAKALDAPLAWLGADG